MKKSTLLIIKREYLAKVKKRSFIIMTFLGPLLLAGIMLLAIYFSSKQEDKALVHVVDETNIFGDYFENTPNYTFVRSFENPDSLKMRLIASGDYTMLHIPATKLNVPESAIIYSNKQPTSNLKLYIGNRMSKEVEKLKLSSEIIKQLQNTIPNYNHQSDSARLDLMSENILKNIKTNIKITTLKTDETGNEKESFTEVAMIIGYICSLMIYMFIFMYGSQVMSGVIEEKTSRIIEVMVSSVKPIQLMLGKIIGIAAVGLTQFLLWVVLTFVLIGAAQIAFPDVFSTNTQSTTQMISGGIDNEQLNQFMQVDSSGNNQIIEEAIKVVKSMNIPVILFSFVIYFLLGYLLYSALFAAIGAAVDNDADTQQFLLPVTVPLLLGILVSQNVIQNPEGQLAFWLSMIPFTSPIVMVTRVPFGVPMWELALSIVLLALGFWGTVWLSSKIYKTGILMYGKKPSYKEIWKWLKYKN